VPRIPVAPADVARLLTNLLPTGDAWPQDGDSVQQQVLAALSATFSRLNDRANQLVVEAFPRTSVELLTEWENSLGLPDRCSPLGSTVAQRQAAVVAKLVSLGGQSIPYFIAVAAALGQVVTVDQFAPFRVDANYADDPVQGDDFAFYWQVNVPHSRAEYPFYADTSYADEPLDAFDTGSLECRLNMLKPAHTFLGFAYPATTATLRDAGGSALADSQGNHPTVL
jgi:uncharacterized protein YmfQ (DUF2313 family)